ncbi:kinase-like protein [Gigaspora margarita]|uniref:Kinase-like protein n=1 Tax=Gigaspora margarita TaxID=4874 RepID=A0A8H4AMJ8_GIGMA|nr:kinase-like protein [Gigaspora margarita]
MMMYIDKNDDFLTPKGKIIKRDKFNSWVESCYKTYANLQVVSYGDLVEIYEIFEEPTRGRIKSILKAHEHDYSLLKTLGSIEEVDMFKTYHPLSKSIYQEYLKLSDIKQEILMTDSVQVDSSIIYYRVRFKNKLKSNDYQLYGSTSIFGEQINGKIIKFKATNVFGFTVIIKNISKITNDSRKMIINWMLVGNPEIINIVEPENIENLYKFSHKNSRFQNFIILKVDSQEISLNQENNWVISLPILPNLPINSVFAYSFKYPSNSDSLFLTCVKFDGSNNIRINITNYTDYDDELKDNFKYQIHWCIYITSIQKVTIGHFIFEEDLTKTIKLIKPSSKACVSEKEKDNYEAILTKKHEGELLDIEQIMADTSNELNELISNIIKGVIKNINNEGNEVIKKCEYNLFSNLIEISSGPFGNICKATWEKSTIVLKCITIDTSQIDSEITSESKNANKNISFDDAIVNNKVIFRHEINLFINELMILASAQKHKHPNIIQFYGITNDPLKNQYNLILQYATSGNLREYLKSNFSKLKWPDKLRHAHEIAKGLSFLHDKKVFHGDLHSKNILVHNQRMLIAGFGLSKHMNEVNCLGVTFWEISSGRPPYDYFETRYAILFHVYKGNRETPVENTPSNFVNLYQRCWDQEPEKRPEIKIVLEELKNMRLSLIDDQKAFHEKWIESKIIEGKINEHNIDEFEDYKLIDSGASSTVYRARYKSTKNICTLKVIEKNNHTTKELVKELDHMLSIESHENIIKFHGITYKINTWDPNVVEYVLILEYADNGTLRDYLHQNSTKIEWKLKVQFAIQLVEAVKWLHAHNIVHGDLHPNNILLHQKTLKLADFGLSRRVIEASMYRVELFGVIPYIDPQCFITEQSKNGNLLRYRKNKKSDIYSIGVILWEISSERQPFKNENPASLPGRIMDGLREKPIADTPHEYVAIYSKCWHSLQDDRPSIEEVAMAFEDFIVQYITENDNCDIFDKLGFEEFITNTLGNVNFNIKLDGTAFGQDEMTRFVYNLYSCFSKLFNEGKSVRDIIINYISQNNKTNEEVFQWLLANNTHSRNICLLGLFYRLYIGTDKNNPATFNLFVNAADKGDVNAQYFVGRCYAEGWCTEKNKERQLNAFYFLKRATGNGNYKALNYLGLCYQRGQGTDINAVEGLRSFKRAALRGLPTSQYELGNCYEYGIGTEINLYKALIWYRKATDANPNYRIHQKRAENKFLSKFIQLQSNPD